MKYIRGVIESGREFGLAVIATRNFLLHVTSDSSTEVGDCYITNHT
jgi:hypothetical protein